jgi:hypothetical protein
MAGQSPTDPHIMPRQLQSFWTAALCPHRLRQDHETLSGNRICLLPSRGRRCESPRRGSRARAKQAGSRGWFHLQSSNLLPLFVKIDGRCLTQQQNGQALRAHTSLLTADPSSATASKLSLHGRVLGVSRAVSRDEADKLREERDKKGTGKGDRRNLYLMREGGAFKKKAVRRGIP